MTCSMSALQAMLQQSRPFRTCPQTTWRERFIFACLAVESHLLEGVDSYEDRPSVGVDQVLRVAQVQSMQD